jgi:hypothetical protein
MRTSTPLLPALAVALLMTQALPLLAAEADLDALSLESAPPAAPEVDTSTKTKLFVEGAMGRATQRYLPDYRNVGRASVDFTVTSRLTPDVRGVLSNRLDHQGPTDAGVDATVNSLREAYVSWQPDGGNTVWELGRINLRYGPAYGYNPTDFFRDGSLRTLTSTNPFAMRENRLGSVMLRAQRLWQGGSMSAVVSPKLADQANPAGWNVDLGATNHRDRGLVELSTQFSDRVSTQVLAYKEQDQPTTVGASLTALLSDAAVAHLEWSRASEVDPLSRALAVPGNTSKRNRVAAGVTYTTLSKLSVTAEYQYNGFGFNRQEWDALATLPMAKVAYLMDAQRLQEQVPQQAYLIYVTQKSLFLKDLDLTAFLRVNAEDQSRLTWLELRHHWPQVDMALQWQQYSGDISSEYGILPDSRIVQLLLSYYF